MKFDKCQDCGAAIEPTNMYPWCDRCWGKVMDEMFPEFAPHYEE